MALISKNAQEEEAKRNIIEKNKRILIVDDEPYNLIG